MAINFSANFKQVWEHAVNSVTAASDLWEFWAAVGQLGLALSHEQVDWRFGQLCFNFLYTVRPGLAEDIRGHPVLDPYYKVDHELDPFINWLTASWTVLDEPIEEDENVGF